MANALRISNYQRPVNLLEIANRGQQPVKNAAAKTDASFKNIMNEQLADKAASLNFSKHAQERLHSRGINLSPETLQKISGAIDKAQAKGSRETLVLTDDVALVVGVKERTVITAFDKEKLREGIVTSIDSAVIL
jgi:flagellar operon protein